MRPTSTFPLGPALKLIRKSLRRSAPVIRRESRIDALSFASFFQNSNLSLKKVLHHFESTYRQAAAKEYPAVKSINGTRRQNPALKPRTTVLGRMYSTQAAFRIRPTRNFAFGCHLHVPSAVKQFRQMRCPIEAFPTPLPACLSGHAIFD